MTASDGYTVYGEFDNIGGLKVRAPVKSAGVVVGRVEGIVLDQQKFVAKVTMRLDNRYKFPKDTLGVDPHLRAARRAVHRAGGGRRHRQSEARRRIKLTQSAVVLEKIIGQFLYGKAAEGNTAKVAPCGSSDLMSNKEQGDGDDEHVEDGRCPAVRGTCGACLRWRCGASCCAGAEAPDKLVKDVANDVLRSLREDPELRAGSQTKMAELIEKKVAPHFDFERMTRLAVGPQLAPGDAEQQKAADRAVPQLAGALLQHRLQRVPEHRRSRSSRLRMQPGDDDVQVQSEIKLPGGAPPVNVDYSMYKADSDWKVYDVMVDGVSLVTTYRSTFAEEIRQNGIDGLIKSLRDKNAPAAAGRKKAQ